MNTGKFFINILLIATFILFGVVILVPLAAEIQFNSAQKLAGGYLWERAEEKFSEAISIDPFNAVYPAGLADFLKDISATRQDEAAFLKRAQRYYARALELNPYSAEYFLRSGQLKLELFFKDTDKYKDELSGAIDDFRMALKNDPNGFNISYVVGYSLLRVWPSVNDKTRELVVNRLRYVLQFKRWFWEYIYPWAWQNTNDFRVLERIAPQTETAHRDLLYFIETSNLYQFRKKEIESVDYYMKKEEPEKFLERKKEKSERIDAIKKSLLLNSSPQRTIAAGEWHGKTADGVNEFKDGQMYWTGSMSALLVAPEGQATLAIQAKGSPADGIYPYMVVEIDGEEVGGAFINNEEWKEYGFPLETSAGVKVLSITYCNDGADDKKNEDRNLFIGEARIVSDVR